MSKKVGTAVRRNLVRRRLKAACRELVDGGATAVDVVVRALPTAAAADFPTLRADVAAALAARGRRRSPVDPAAVGARPVAAEDA